MKTRIALLVSVLISASVACSFSSRAIGGGATDAPDIIFKDDFSDPSSGWDHRNDSEGVTDYYNDGYRIQVNTDNRFFFANPGLTDLPNDVSIEVEVTKIGGSDDNSFGIICRYQDVNNFYRFIATSDGYAGIILVQNDTTTNLSGETLVSITAVNPGNTSNKLRVDCIGNTLSLYVNGEKVLTEEDSTHSNGDVGLFAGTYEEPGTEILFDNFVVTRP